ncbi:hypothetical protein Tco_1029262 [Tanacetum coccineum]|uniref:Uncharacterized protein n=1 Tax=Tanacetum coccineum TaxID=301880 RepID=A0ABQ5G2X7_9ASTR
MLREARYNKDATITSIRKLDLQLFKVQLIGVAIAGIDGIWEMYAIGWSGNPPLKSQGDRCRWLWFDYVTAKWQKEHVQGFGVERYNKMATDTALAEPEI